MLRGIEIASAIALAQATKELLKELSELSEQLKPFKPDITGFRFYEMWDLDKMETVNSPWAFNGEKWLLDVTKLPSSERYWLTVKGRVSKEFLDQLVSIKAAENPSREEENDFYWIHSALRNADALEKIWTELNIEQVNANVRIGVERMFASAIPEGIKDKLALQRKLLD